MFGQISDYLPPSGCCSHGRCVVLAKLGPHDLNIGMNNELSSKICIWKSQVSSTLKFAMRGVLERKESSQQHRRL